MAIQNGLLDTAVSVVRRDAGGLQEPSSVGHDGACHDARRQRDDSAELGPCPLFSPADLVDGGLLRRSHGQEDVAETRESQQTDLIHDGVVYELLAQISLDEDVNNVVETDEEPAGDGTLPWMRRRRLRCKTCAAAMAAVYELHGPWFTGDGAETSAAATSSTTAPSSSSGSTNRGKAKKTKNKKRH